MGEHKCPLCDNFLKSLFGTTEKHHYTCPECHHPWYVADLWAVASERLRGKTDEEIRNKILKEDQRRK